MAARMPHPAQSVPAHSHQQPIKTVAKGAALYNDVAHGERSTQQGLQSIQSNLQKPAMIALLGMPVMWAANKLPLARTKVVLGSFFKATGQALEKTNVGDICHLPANYMCEVAEQAKAANVSHWANSAKASSATLATRGTEWSAKLSKTFGESGIMKSMPGFMKSAATRIKGANLFVALAVAGAGAGVAAAVVGSRAESKESKAAFKDLLNDIGQNGDGTYAQAVKATFSKHKKSVLARGGVEAATSVVDGLLWATPRMGPIAALGASAVPQIGGMLIPESPTLGAYVALKKAERGELKLDHGAKISALKQLLAVKPTIAKNGGIYSRLNATMAEEIVQRNMSTKQVVQLLDNETAFDAFTSDISAKFEAQKAIAKASASSKEAMAAAPAHTRAEAAYHAAAKPQAAVVGNFSHQGMVNQAQLARHA